MGIFVREMPKTLQIDSAALTDRGQRREINEDYIFHQTGRSPEGDGVGLFIVCDGLGGHQAGEIASRMAVEIITTELSGFFALPASSNGHATRPSALTLAERIERAIAKANTEIQAYAQKHPERASNLGTTVTLALLTGNLAH